MNDVCPFCSPDERHQWWGNETGAVLLDGFPVSKGHTLVVPNEHVASIFDLSIDSQLDLWQLVAEAKHKLNDLHQPDGFNIGINDGEAAGQTVMHAHIHVIPRWIGDVPDPRGGVRWVCPSKAQYWGDE